jgi:hypothetical protein
VEVSTTDNFVDLWKRIQCGDEACGHIFCGRWELHLSLFSKYVYMCSVVKYMYTEKRRSSLLETDT